MLSSISHSDLSSPHRLHTHTHAVWRGRGRTHTHAHTHTHIPHTPHPAAQDRGETHRCAVMSYLTVQTSYLKDAGNNTCRWPQRCASTCGECNRCSSTRCKSANASNLECTIVSSTQNVSMPHGSARHWQMSAQVTCGPHVDWHSFFSRVVASHPVLGTRSALGWQNSPSF